jgi:hypothetical protein
MKIREKQGQNAHEALGRDFGAVWKMADGYPVVGGQK